MKTIDLTGQRFGRLTVIERDYSIPNRKNIYWRCLCDCGNTKSVLGASLRSGSTSSCGCLKEENLKSLWSNRCLDITGERFGRLVALHKDTTSTCRTTKWVCRCDCGNVKSFRLTDLTSGNTKSCGCLSFDTKKNRFQQHIEAVVGKRFGYLVVLGRDDDFVGRHVHMLCKCDCGNVVSVDINNLKRGNSTSCGCRKRKLSSDRMKNRNPSLREDISGKRFGHLVATCFSHKSRGLNFWNCLCDCGNHAVVDIASLKRGKTKSCGLCRHKSFGEEAVARLLSDNGLPFVHDKPLYDCVNPKTGRLYRFDFFVDGKYVIEYDGEQHFSMVRTWDRSTPLEERIANDKAKNKWCFDHNVPIIRIPYTHYSDLCFEDLVPETSPFLLQPD